VARTSSQEKENIKKQAVQILISCIPAPDNVGLTQLINPQTTVTNNEV
jgi:hypothetical protein